MSNIMNSNLPDGLRHILEVCKLVRLSHRTRIDAINTVASKCRIDPQTVRSACTRSIGIKAAELDNLLMAQNFTRLSDLLVKRFPPYQKNIDTFFKQLEGDDKTSADDATRIVRTLFPDEKKDLMRRLLLHDVRKKLMLWSVRDDVPETMKHEIAEITKRIDTT